MNLQHGRALSTEQANCVVAFVDMLAVEYLVVTATIVVATVSKQRTGQNRGRLNCAPEELFIVLIADNFLRCAASVSLDNRCLYLFRSMRGV